MMAAGPVGQALMFEVTMAVPARQQKSCDSWFGSREVSHHVISCEFDVNMSVGGGFRAWAWLRKQDKHSMAAGPVGQPLMFEVAMAVPARQQRSCDSWFGSREVGENVDS
jgi:hypothetical protein